MRTDPLQKWLLLNVESLHKSLVSPLIAIPSNAFFFSPVLVSSITSSLIFLLSVPFSPFQHLHLLFFFQSPPSLTFPLSPPGWQRAVIWQRPADDWQLRVLWLPMNSVKQSAAQLCNCNEGQKERQRGTELFSYSVSCHTLLRKSTFLFFSFRPLPNYSCILLSQPHSPWRGSEGARLKRHKADITFACISYAGVFLGLC